MKNLLFIFFCSASIISAAQTAREDIAANPCKAGNNYYAYPTPTSTLSPAPKGYKPFYISHYGRHGSRWLIGTREYTAPYETLKKAKDANALTDLGKSLTDRLGKVVEASENRLGELSLLGHEQHRGIADRMYHNFPEIFVDGTTVDAKSTVVIRCIFSMTNETQRLAELNPELNIHTDASEDEMYYMNFGDRHIGEVRFGANDEINNFIATHSNFKPLMQRLFSDVNYVKKIDIQRLGFQIFSVVINQQSICRELDIDFSDIFTNDELYDMWRCRNVRWYVEYASSPITKGIMPYSQRNLLENILNTADTCVTSPRCNATLRFGHEICVLPLVCLLGLNGADIPYDDLETLDQNWQSYKVIPMGCNVQIVFYRTQKASDDILVKFLLNENEARLPEALKPVEFPYYKWTDVEKYYREKLDNYKANNK